VSDTILAKELECDLHPTNGRHLSGELDKAHAHVDRIDGERVTEAKQLSQQVMRISNILVNLGLLSIQDIPQLPKSTQEVLPVVDLILKHLQEALPSGIGLWDYIWDDCHAHDYGPSASSLFRFLLYFAPRNGCKTHFNIYIYIYIYMCVCVCIYYGNGTLVSLRPCAPNHNELGPFGLG
jgi:hypothetical protein